MTIEEVKKEVKSWDGCLSIFEIYDELKNTFTSDKDQYLLLNYAYEYFNSPSSKNSVMQLMSFIGHKLEEQEAVRELFKMDTLKGLKRKEEPKVVLSCPRNKEDFFPNNEVLPWMAGIKECIKDEEWAECCAKANAIGNSVIRSAIEGLMCDHLEEMRKRKEDTKS